MSVARSRKLFISRRKVGPLRMMHSVVDSTRKARISRNHDEWYTSYRPSFSKATNQNWPNSKA
ncbi:hypothetical protein D3C78_1919810 [compost metagenome]